MVEMLRSAFRGLALVLALSLLSSAGAEGATRAPTSKWVVDFHEKQCVAFRDYGTAEEPLTLALKAPATGNMLQLIVATRGPGRQLAEQANGSILINGQQRLPVSFIIFRPQNAKLRQYRANLALERFPGLSSATSLTVVAGRFNETFELSQMVSIRKLLDDCTADLKNYWNVGPEGSLSPKLRSSAEGSVKGLIKSEDYPEVSIQDLASGSVRFLLLVNEAGRVVDCTVTETSGIAALDAQSCSIVVERARFKPAVGIDGKPARGALEQRVTWRVE